jgi:hypothetical protein
VTPKYTVDELKFGRLGSRKIEADFAGEAIRADGGLRLIREVDRRLGLAKAVANIDVLLGRRRQGEGGTSPIAGT